MTELSLPQRSPLADYRPAIAAGLLAIALFAVTLGGTYIYDDLYIIGLDPRLRDPSRWGEYWTKDYFNGGVDNLYRPLVSMSYALQWWLHGDRPWAYHAVNVLLHATASACVAELARRVAGMRAAYVAGLLFAAHPVHVEAVANVVGRAEVACAAAVTGALVMFAHRPLTHGRAVAIWALLVCAILSKEQGLLLPLMLVVLHLFDRHLTPANKIATSHFSASPFSASESAPAAVDERKPMRTLLLLVCWTMAAYIAFRETILKFWWDRIFLDWTQNPIVRAEGLERWLMPLALFGRYVMLLVFPHKLSIDYGGRVIGHEARPDDPYLYIGAIAAIACAVGLVIALRRRNGPVAFALLCFGMVYGLVGNIVTIIGTNFGERLMYLPSVFFAILVGVALARLPRAVLITAMSVIMGFASLRTFTYAERWNDRLAFMESQVRTQPTSVRLRLLLADELIRRKEYERADAVMAAAREVQPDYPKVWIQSAVVAFLLDDVDRAEALARRAVELDPMAGNSGIRKLIEERRAATQRSATTSTTAVTAATAPAQ
ncbi:MAG TPA: glycosyltransferase family 39 protein [Tepidisphaeraceae bacterium]|nr:glycosyltransferase family 39 protein [Tepidisphaeraceae bacterium]